MSRPANGEESTVRFPLEDDARKADTAVERPA